MQKVAKLYSSGKLHGWAGVDHPVLLREAFRMFKDSSAYMKGLPKFGDIPEHFSLHRVARQVLNRDVGGGVQEIGDCVSWGMKHAAEYTQCCDILMRGDREEFKFLFAPFYYGSGRVYVGGGRLGNSDGSLGSWMAEAAIKYGSIFVDDPGVPSYSGSVAKRWGDPNPSDDLDKHKELAVKRLLTGGTKVNSFDELCNYLANGYPCTVASNQGFQMTPGRDGYHEASGNWAHQMCHKPNTIISLYQPKLIRNMRIGDKLFNHLGKVDTVTDVIIRTYIGDMITIKCWKNLPFEVTPEHPVLVLRDKGSDIEEYSYEDLFNIRLHTLYDGKVIKWVRAKDVRASDMLLTPKIAFPESVELPKVPEGISLYPDDDIAWFFGLYAADGNSVPNHKIRITLANHETEIADRCIEVLAKIGLTATKKVKENHILITAYHAKFANFMLENFGKAQNKSLPNWLLTRQWNLLNVVDGVFDGDGTKTSSDAKRIVNTSIKLVTQLRHILINYNIVPSLSSFEYKKESQENWQTRYSLEYMYSRKNHQTISEFHSDYLAFKIRNINVDHYDGPVWNLEVENGHSYIANGLVSHNCYFGYGPDYGLIANSWGDVHGKLKCFDKGDDLPVGTIRARKNVVERMISAGETFAFTGIEGFKLRDIPRELFRLIGRV